MYKEFEPAKFVCPRLDGIERVSTGRDSRVFRNGDLVIKAYYLGTEPEPLLFYRDVTNFAAELLDKENFTVSLPVSGDRIPLRVNPFIDMYTCEACGRVKGIAKYVPGTNLETVPRIFDIEEMKMLTRTLGYTLERKLGVGGITLIPLNMKADKGTFVITDLCADISQLRKR